ncbi:glycosyltransferase [Kutzneria buriramensis]|uniref:UDP:flavonoid glycosyltransferase YjiC (YdhE family) n=1 Tax=Kutzneria buriramensis TaxID=1045776 RepID=A0A3E0H8K0_9PSEU|nr:glycosyltransferase [Kutzneria buriramensis]REH39494.1 UDP:flavonoid glycosyltransferase YjiC (YdhE family) [Kutzneria buriramensis]
MRILFSGTGIHGHLLPMMPLARAFAARGHAVGFLTSSQATDLVKPEAFDLLATEMTIADAVADTLRATGIDMIDKPEPRGAAYIFAGSAVDLSAEPALAMAGDWRPDLLVHEISDHIGPVVAAALGTPAAMFAYGPRRPDEYTAAMDEVVASRYADRGLIRVPPLRYVDICPPSVNYPEWRPPAPRQLLRPEAYRQPWSQPQTVPAKGDRPRALVSFGTVFGRAEQLSPLVDALVERDLDVVVTLNADADRFDVDRTRVHLSRFVPLETLLVGVDVMVTHGGAGTTLAALAHGVPLVVLPQGADHPRQAERVVNADAGIALVGDEATPDAVAAAAIRVLTDPVIRAGAALVRDEIAAMPSPDDVARILETTWS